MQDSSNDLDLFDDPEAVEVEDADTEDAIVLPDDAELFADCEFFAPEDAPAVVSGKQEATERAVKRVRTLCMAKGANQAYLDRLSSSAPMGWLEAKAWSAELFAASR